jgi:hypothetical protein
MDRVPPELRGRWPPAGQIIIRGRTTNKSATLYLAAPEVSTTPTLQVNENPSHPQVRPHSGHD